MSPPPEKQASAPPSDHAKLVYCIRGQVLDAVVDLRRGSPTFGRHATFDLCAEKANALYLPPGLAHGFCTMSETATVVYKVTTEYAPEHDGGILWNSAGIGWTEASPVLSGRDLGFPPLENFQTPFVWQENLS